MKGSRQVYSGVRGLASFDNERVDRSKRLVLTLNINEETV